MGVKVKGRMTFRTAAVLFFLSAAYEIFNLSNSVPLLGAIRSGLPALLYHMGYVALYGAVGFGLWQAKKWGYRLVFIATAVYTLDRVQLMVDRELLVEAFMRSLGFYRDALQGVDTAALVQALNLMFLFTIGCWWGFAAYTLFRRGYFGIGVRKSSDPNSF
jgi:hypothetical protein